MNRTRKGITYIFCSGKKIVVFSLSVIFLLLFIQSLYAQQLATTQNGDLVVLYNDGSWSYAPDNTIDNSRESHCTFEVQQVEADSGFKKTLLKKTNFISFTYDLINRENRMHDYIECDLALGEENGIKTVYLDYTLDTPLGLLHFGIIQEGKKLLIKLRDHSTVELTLENTDKGMIDETNSRTKYHTFAYLNPITENLLKSNEVERILMPWSRGNEIYPVSNPRIFIDQLICFD